MLGRQISVLLLFRMWNFSVGMLLRLMANGASCIGLFVLLMENGFLTVPSVMTGGQLDFGGALKIQWNCANSVRVAGVLV